MKRVLLACVLAGISAASLADEMPRDTYVGVLGDWDARPGKARQPQIDDGFGFELILGSRKDMIYGATGELQIFWDHLNPKSGGPESRHRDGVVGDLQYPFQSFGALTPYAIGGIGLSQSNAHPDLTTHIGPLVEVGGGVVSSALNGWGLRARAEVKYVVEKFSGDDNAYRDLHLLAGIEIPLASHPAPRAAAPAPKPAPEPAPVEAPKAKPAPPPAKKEEFKKVLTLKGVNFQTNSDKLTPASLPLLDEAAKTLNKDFPEANVVVAGHTDDRGNPEHNKALSQHRADAVRKYLIEHGVKADRLTAEGLGSSQPAADNKTKEGRAKNRRVELRVR
jgi:OOP family OmpA-OmpF porin